MFSALRIIFVFISLPEVGPVSLGPVSPAPCSDERTFGLVVPSRFLNPECLPFLWAVLFHVAIKVIADHTPCPCTVIISVNALLLSVSRVYL